MSEECLKWPCVVDRVNMCVCDREKAVNPMSNPNDSPTFKELKKERKKAGEMALEIGRLRRAAEESNEKLSSIVVKGENMETEVRAIGDLKRRMESV